MPGNAIVVENLSKRYLLGHRARGEGKYKYTAFRDVIGREVRDFARKARDLVRGRQIVQGDEVEEFWALTTFALGRAKFLELLVVTALAKARC
jgi:lipopolysaccharide transport system ATP-binding protein